MKYFLNLIFCVFLLSNNLHAQQVGLDLLGLAKHDIQMVKSELESGMSLGFLDGTFGDPYPNLKVLLDSGRITSVRIHLWDHTCYRNRVCPRGTPPATDIRRVTNRTKRFTKFMQAYPNVKQYISPALEHDVKDQAVVNKWFFAIVKEAPLVIPVCSAFTGYCPSTVGTKKILKEKHGCKAKADIISPDGESHFDCNNFTYNSQAKKIVYSWINQNNGRVTGEKTFTPPKERVNWPTRQDIRQQVALLYPATAKPKVTGCKDLKSPRLFKTNAEYFGKDKDDGRGNKPMVIHPRKISKFEIFSIKPYVPNLFIKDKKAGEMRYYGSYQGGGYRYYIGGRYGSNQTPVELRNDLNSEWGVLEGAGECYYINAIRRLGYYR